MSIKPRDYQVHEILTEIEEIKSRSNKIEHFRTKFGDHVPLLRILKMGFCETIIPTVPPGKPPFNEEEVDGPNRESLWSYVGNFPVFVRSGQSMKMRAIQIERMFIEMLEAIDPKEANTVILAKDKELTTRWPSITIELVREAFPSLEIKTSEPVQELSEEEKAEQLLDEAKRLKEEAKEMNAKARKITAEAKKMMGAA